jgi:hypothetical protein
MDIRCAPSPNRYVAISSAGLGATRAWIYAEHDGTSCWNYLVGRRTGTLIGVGFDLSL